MGDILKCPKRLTDSEAHLTLTCAVTNPLCLSTAERLHGLLTANFLPIRLSRCKYKAVQLGRSPSCARSVLPLSASRGATALFITLWRVRGIRSVYDGCSHANFFGICSESKCLRHRAPAFGRQALFAHMRIFWKFAVSQSAFGTVHRPSADKHSLLTCEFFGNLQ